MDYSTCELRKWFHCVEDAEPDIEQPKRDPRTGELVLYHSLMIPPYLQYSVIPSRAGKTSSKRIVGAPVPICELGLVGWGRELALC